MGDRFRTTPEWRLGEWGEAGTRDWLTRRGECVLPVSLIENGGAPRVLAHLAGWTAPDVLTFGPAGTRWWEVKTKTAPVYHYVTRTHRHGIGARVWGEYCAVCAATATPGVLVVVQRQPRALLAQAFDVLARTVHEHDGSTVAHGERMVFWDVGAFGVLDLDEHDTLCIRSPLTGAARPAPGTPPAPAPPVPSTFPAPQQSMFDLDES